METKNTISAEYFFHFTNKIEHIENIMQVGFKPFYCLEKLEYFNNSEYSEQALAFPIVCFCDLPFSLHVEHKIKFGDYAIGLKKEWGLINGLSPVIYSHRYSSSSAAISHLKDLYNELFRDEDNLPFDTKKILTWKNSFNYLFMLFKAVEGHYYIKNEKEFSAELRKFYDEREWRFLPKFMDGISLSLSFNDYQDEKKYAEKTQELQKSNTLSFTIDDIEYIILKKESEAEAFLNKMEKIYNKEEIKVISKKIENGFNPSKSNLKHKIIKYFKHYFISHLTTYMLHQYF